MLFSFNINDIGDENSTAVSLIIKACPTKSIKRNVGWRVIFLNKAPALEKSLFLVFKIVKCSET